MTTKKATDNNEDKAIDKNRRKSGVANSEGTQWKK